MKKNYDRRVVTIDVDQYERLKRIAEQSVRDHGGNDDFERIQRHVSKFNPYVPNEVAKIQIDKFKTLRAIKKRLNALVRMAGASGSEQTYYVTGQWAQRMGLYVPVRIVGRVGSSWKHPYQQLAVRLHESTTPALLKALDQGRNYFRTEARVGDWLRPTYDSLVRFNWTNNQLEPRDPAIRKPIFAVNPSCLVEELPPNAVLVTEEHEGVMLHVIRGCYLTFVDRTIAPALRQILPEGTR